MQTPRVDYIQDKGKILPIYTTILHFQRQEYDGMPFLTYRYAEEEAGCGLGNTDISANGRALYPFKVHIIQIIK